MPLKSSSIPASNLQKNVLFQAANPGSPPPPPNYNERHRQSLDRATASDSTKPKAIHFTKKVSVRNDYNARAEDAVAGILRGKKEGSGEAVYFTPPPPPPHHSVSIIMPSANENQGFWSLAISRTTKLTTNRGWWMDGWLNGGTFFYRLQLIRLPFDVGNCTLAVNDTLSYLFNGGRRESIRKTRPKEIFTWSQLQQSCPSFGNLGSELSCAVSLNWIICTSSWTKRLHSVCYCDFYYKSYNYSLLLIIPKFHFPSPLFPSFPFATSHSVSRSYPSK